MLKRLLCTIVCPAVLAVSPPAALAATSTGRVFLLDGTALTCAGEYARVNGRIVFSMPLGAEPDGQPRLQLLTLPEGRVDWTRTERYREAMRAAHYAETSGERDFTAMTAEVARTLNDIAFAPDAATKLALAEQARSRLVHWPAEHFGYRANEVRDIAALLDEAVSDLRAAAGARSFDLDLVAMVVPETVPLLADPAPHDIVAAALAAADAADVPEEREGLLTAVVAYLDGPDASTLSGTSRVAARSFAERRLEAERRADRDYEKLTRTVTAESAVRAAHADVRAIEQLTATVGRRDASLGHRRPERVRSLMTALAEDLAAARRLRLAQDRWTLRVSAYRSYTRLVRTPLSSLEVMRTGLEDIKRLAGPDTATLARLGDLGDRAGRRLQAVVPPSDLASVHSLLQSACEMGRSAARIRLDAVKTGDMTVAWNASAAAAGSLMLLAQARDELARYLAPPSAR